MRPLFERAGFVMASLSATVALGGSACAQIATGDLVPSDQFPSPYIQRGDGSMTDAIWNLFFRLSIDTDDERKLEVIEEFSGLTGNSAQELLFYAASAWMQQQDQLADRRKLACAERDSVLSPSELLDRIIEAEHQRERMRYLAVARMFELLGQEATQTIVDTVDSGSGRVLLEEDWLLVVLRETPQEYLGRWCGN